jgi:hypothetical protein
MFVFNMDMKAMQAVLAIGFKNNAWINNAVFKRGILCKWQHLIIFVRQANYYD